MSLKLAWPLAWLLCSYLQQYNQQQAAHNTIIAEHINGSAILDNTQVVRKLSYACSRQTDARKQPSKHTNVCKVLTCS
jgi:hypothetical protein